MAPRVVHLKREPYDVRVDRQTPWGNPFVIPKDGARELVIAKYRNWILSDRDMTLSAQKLLKGKTLGCWCAPKPCHGDVLLEIANNEVWWCESCNRYHVERVTAESETPLP